MYTSEVPTLAKMDTLTPGESHGKIISAALQMEPCDRVAAAVIIAPDAEPNGGTAGPLIQ